MLEPIKKTSEDTDEPGRLARESPGSSCRSVPRGGRGCRGGVGRLTDSGRYDACGAPSHRRIPRGHITTTKWRLESHLTDLFKNDLDVKYEVSTNISAAHTINMY